MKKYGPTTISAQCLLLFLLSYQLHLSTASENAPTKPYIVYMGERKHSDPSLVVDSHHTMLATVLGGSKEEAADSILYSYKHGFSGFAARLTDSRAHMIAGPVAPAGIAAPPAPAEETAPVPPGGLIEWNRRDTI